MRDLMPDISEPVAVNICSTEGTVLKMRVKKFSVCLISPLSSVIEMKEVRGAIPRIFGSIKMALPTLSLVPAMIHGAVMKTPTWGALSIFHVVK
jgi:hypothetical protein